jgi:hypothetical protein
MEFIRRFLQHVLPTGFMKIRYYGFMNPNCAIPLERIRGLIELSYGFAIDLPVPKIKLPRRSTCPSCGGLLKFCSVLPAAKLLRLSGQSHPPSLISDLQNRCENGISKATAPKCAHVADQLLSVLSLGVENGEKSQI